MLRNSNRCNASLQTVKKPASVYSQAGGNNQSQRNSTSQSSADSPDEEADLTVAKEQRRFAHSAAEQKRRDAIRVSCCFAV